ncbi:uncharacterized protein BXIN_1350 [Babesia sp. Xinjiang]|uniref:uncharacterized protein n=1 Tax=Babesia sp. Xinjiang TaxID=462227 RepID=UPI000A224D92|nr:uncharacterized protein BXIN_1350 [Babesia sp. Xinjiang]ORM39915.1 hypothetical protein BXIN_1350 [Babesia sp. Xinjiang]
MELRASASETVTESGEDEAADSEPYGGQRLLIPLLFYVGYTVNIFIYFVYACSIFELFDRLLDRLEASGSLHLHFAQRLIIEGFLTICVSFSWSSLITQGFDGDAFSHVLYWHYRLINTREMLSRFFGCISAGSLYGLLFSSLAKSTVVTVDMSRDLYDPPLRGCTNCKTFTELFVIPISHVSSFFSVIWQLAEKLGLPFHLGDTVRRNVVLLENFAFEFWCCLAVYLVVSVRIVAERFADCSALHVAFKRLAAFTANTYLRDMDGWVSLDASISMRRFFDDRSKSLLVVRILANYLAVVAAARTFNPTRRLRHCDFVEIYENVHDHKKRSMQPKNGSCGHVYTDSVVDKDLRFTPFPDTLLGRWFTRRVQGLSKVKGD